MLMELPTLSVTITSGIAKLTFINGKENRFTPKFIADLHSAMDFIEQFEPKVSCVMTTGKGKFYSNGIDVNILDFDFLTDWFYPFLNRWLVWEIPTIAVINGHCFAGGMLLALCHDFRIMTSEKGWMCMNELAIGINLSVGLAGILKAKITDPIVLRDTIMCKRWTAAEALKVKILDAVGKNLEEIESTANSLAQRITSNPMRSEKYSMVKREIYSDAVASLNCNAARDIAPAVRKGKSKL